MNFWEALFYISLCFFMVTTCFDIIKLKTRIMMFETKDFLKSKSSINVNAKDLTDAEVEEIKKEMLEVLKKHGLEYEEVVEFGEG